MKNEASTADRHAFGFWVYLMTDLVIFGVLFAVYFVLQPATFGAPSAHDLFSLPTALANTLVLLTSSFTCGLATLAARRGKVNQVIAWLAVTFVLGATFLTIELTEFSHFISLGADWTKSAFLSSFFTLVGTHGLHISVGLLWIVVAIVQLKVRGLTPPIISKLDRFTLFWHFLDIVWIFIFTTVYLMGIM
ncbi:MAG TPA: cytochrome o ubiquinol oxidase subunit III [Candidatus Paceibacterota bacterium]|nr:cytochrome o ubiquinol oxidase subunit III [Candidatus Paceibacterota bacterium]